MDRLRVGALPVNELANKRPAFRRTVAQQAGGQADALPATFRPCRPTMARPHFVAGHNGTGFPRVIAFNEAIRVDMLAPARLCSINFFPRFE